MANWVFKPDGTIQCEGGVGETLAEARADLARLVGDENIVEGEARSLTVIALCGAPTGRVNAFELTDEGVVLFETGFLGHPGWYFWLFGDPQRAAVLAARPEGEAGPEVPFPWQINLDQLLCPDCAFPMKAASESDAASLEAWRRGVEARLLDGVRQFTAPPPTDIQKLKGYKLRVIKPGDQPTLDLRRNRFNVVVDADHVITSIGFY